MEFDELIATLNASLSQFCASESGLLSDDTHEEAISSKLMQYFSGHFAHLQLDIDGQYDKRKINGITEKKRTDFLTSQLPESKRSSGIIIDDDTIRKEVLPDIIFHIRENGDNNFLAIEVKKSTNKNKADREYDKIKLSVYTSGDLRYRYGAFIDFKTGQDFISENPYDLEVYINGAVVS